MLVIVKFLFTSTFFDLESAYRVGAHGAQQLFLGPTGPSGPGAFTLSNGFLKTCLVPGN